MKRLPIWFERTENLAITATVVVVFVRLHFSWWWLPAFFLVLDASMAGYLVNKRAGAVCYNLAHAYVAPTVLLLSFLVVLADDTGGRALPVWLNGPEGHGLFRGDDHPHPEPAEVITAALLRTADWR